MLGFFPVATTNIEDCLPFRSTDLFFRQKCFHLRHKIFRGGTIAVTIN